MEKEQRKKVGKELILLPILEVKEHITALFKMDTLTDKVIDKRNATLELIERERESLTRYPDITDYISQNQLQQELTEKIIPLFVEYDYKLETERHKLY